MASIFLEGWSQIQASQRPTRSILKLNWSSVSLNVSNAALLRNASALKLCRTVTHPPFIPLQPLILHTSRCSVHSAAFNPLSNILLLRSTFHYRSLTVLPLDTACLPFQVRLFPYGTVYYVPSDPGRANQWLIDEAAYVTAARFCTCVACFCICSHNFPVTFETRQIEYHPSLQVSPMIYFTLAQTLSGNWCKKEDKALLLLSSRNDWTECRGL